MELTLGGREASIDAWPAIDRSNFRTKRKWFTMVARMSRVTTQLRVQGIECPAMHIPTVQEMEFKIKIRGKNENFTLNRYCASEICTYGLVFTTVDSPHAQLADAKVVCAALFMLLR